jgi:ferric-dicitrate binding protein FerR (iron transport regulator)
MQTTNAQGDPRTVLRREAQGWLWQLTSGQMTAADAEAFRRWCSLSEAHVRAFADARVLWDNLGPATRAAAMDAQRQGLRPPASGSRLMTRRAFLGGAVAASAAGLLLRSPLSPWPALSGRADYRTGTGEQRRVALARGLVVQMNTQTAIKVHRGGAGMELLAGEALVQADPRLAEAFVITADGGRVLAAAASECNVRRVGAGVQVTCLSGRTDIAYEGNRITVKPSQQIGYGEAGVSPAIGVNLDIAMAWRHRVLIFDGQPLADVIADINRYRPGKIIITDDTLAARKVHARFSLDQMADVTTMIHDAYGAHVTELPGGIVLLS